MRYYVYDLVILPDELTCYVGKGSGNRMHVHLKRVQQPSALNRGNKRLYAKLQEVLASGKTFVPRIVYETDDELDALNKEAERIRAIGFEKLFNVATCGFLGRKLKPEVKAEIAEASRRLWRDPAYREKQKVRIGRKYPYRPKLKLRKPKNRKGKSGFKGIAYWSFSNKAPRWMARITINSKLQLLGYFGSPIEAATAYDDASEKTYATRPNGTKPNSRN